MILLAEGETTGVFVFTTMLGAGISAYLAVSKARGDRRSREAKDKAEAERQAAEREKDEEVRRKESVVSALEEWKKYAGRLEEGRQRDIDRHDTELREMRAGLSKCHQDHTLAQVENARLKEQLIAVERDVRRLQVETGTAVPTSALPVVVTADEYGMIVEATPTVATMLHYTVADLVGRNVKVLIPERYWSRHEEALTEVRTQVRTQGGPSWQDKTIPGSALTSGGTEIPVIIKLHAFQGEGGQWRVAAEITHHRQRDHSVRTRSTDAP